VFGALQGLQGFLAGQLAADAFLRGRAHDGQAASQRFELDLRGFEGTLFHYELVVRHDESSRRAAVERKPYRQTAHSCTSIPRGDRLFADEPTAHHEWFFRPIPAVILASAASESRKQVVDRVQGMERPYVAVALRPSRSARLHGRIGHAFHDGKNFVSWYRTFLQETPATAVRLAGSPPIVPGLQAIKLQSSEWMRGCCCWTVRLRAAHFHWPSANFRMGSESCFCTTPSFMPGARSVAHRIR